MRRQQITHQAILPESDASESWAEGRLGRRVRLPSGLSDRLERESGRCTCARQSTRTTKVESDTVPAILPVQFRNGGDEKRAMFLRNMRQRSKILIFNNRGVASVSHPPWSAMTSPTAPVNAVRTSCALSNSSTHPNWPTAVRPP